MNEEMTSAMAEAIAENLAQVATGVTSITLALFQAIRQQPGVDSDKLLADFIEAIPTGGEGLEGSIPRLLKESLKQL